MVPYVLFSLIPILNTVFLDGGGYALPDDLRDEPLRAIAWYLLTGNIIVAYWYVPMAILLFLLSPLVNKIIKSETILIITLALLPISLIIHRPINNLNAIHSLIYFFPVYLLGSWSSINQKKIYTYLRDRNKKIFLITLAISLGLLQVFVFQQPGNFHKEFWSITVPDVNLLQKIVLCFLFISILDKYEHTEFSILNKVADTSFAIYFLHPFLLNAVFSLFTTLNLNYEGNFLIWIFVAFTTVITSMAIAIGIKAVLKKRSRYLIGW
ncbi:MAG: acyltransferase family protein [Bacteroidota bacterium]